MVLPPLSGWLNSEGTTTVYGVYATPLVPCRESVVVDA